MALSGLDIYKLLPKTNCKECGFATCLAFAMALAQKKVSLDKCPRITAQAKEALDSAAQPPIKLVTVGTGETKIEVGNETVMYRHEQKFFHPAAIGFLVEDTLPESGIDAFVSSVNKLVFERVGQKISASLICVRNSSNDASLFANVAIRIAGRTDLNLALASNSSLAIEEVFKLSGDGRAGLNLPYHARRPLIICEDSSAASSFAEIAKKYNVPIALTCSSLDEAAQLTDIVKKSGVDEIVINFNMAGLSKRLQNFTFARRAALKKNIRALGYPILAFTTEQDPAPELAEAISYVLKYAGIVIMKNVNKDFVFPLLVARQDIYQDPQKPVQVEPKIYEIGKVTKDSPVVVTTNFSITYFTVAGEIESSKVPTYIICCDSEGMSVLTAWAAEKFTAERIAEMLKKCGIEAIVAHKKVIIPGYVSVLSGKLEEVSGWSVSVGPREASGISNYLRNWK